MQIIAAVESLSALAHDTRLAVFRYLVRAGETGSVVSGIRDVLGIADATLSFHLASLKHAGLLQCQRQGRQLVYRVDYKHMRNLLRFLTEDCCGGRPEICSGLTEAAAICAESGPPGDPERDTSA